MSEELLWFVRSTEILSLVIGILVTYYAYSGYRRTKKSTIFLAFIGFALLSVGSALEGLFFEVYNRPLLEGHAARAVFSAVGFILLLVSIKRFK